MCNNGFGREPKEGIPIDAIVVSLSRPAKRRLAKQTRKTKDARLRTRYSIILNLAEGRGPTDTAKALSVSRSTVCRVRRRFLEQGEAGLIDRREENGTRKVDDDYLNVLYELVGGCPLNHGWKRPTWTREMLVESVRQKTGVPIEETTMSRALHAIGARLGSPKPTVASVWSKRARNRRLKEIQTLLDSLPDDEVVVYEDEVDIHLNPKIGRDWMLPGQQKTVLTPGQNQKRYIAGALDARTGELTWVAGERKTAMLFVMLLWRLTKRYSEAKVIHVVLDNYAIHKTQQVEVSLRSEAGSRLRLHFLPPYCPDHNRIERTWQDLHANVTRNHRCGTMDELMANVSDYLKRRNRKKKRCYALAG